MEIVRQSLFESAVIENQEADPLRDDSAWFQGSKVKDWETGDPLVVHHFTYNDFQVFDRHWATNHFKHDPERVDTIGHWFTDNPNARYVVPEQGGKRMDVILALRNPMKFRDYTTREGREVGCLEQLVKFVGDAGGATAFRAHLVEEQGMDGIILLETKLDGVVQNVYIVLENDQIRVLRTQPAEYADAAPELEPERTGPPPLPQARGPCWWAQELASLCRELGLDALAHRRAFSFAFATALAEARHGDECCVAVHDTRKNIWHPEFAAARVKGRLYDIDGEFDPDDYIARAAARDKRKGMEPCRREVRARAEVRWPASLLLTTAQRQALLATLQTGTYPAA